MPRPHFIPGESTPSTHWIGGWVDPRASLDTGARRKILCPCWGSNPDRPTRSQTLYCLSHRGLRRLLKIGIFCFVPLVTDQYLEAWYFPVISCVEHIQNHIVYICEASYTPSLYCNILCIFAQGTRYPQIKATFCGHGQPIDYYSEQNTVRVTFQSNSAVGGKGFKLRYAFEGTFVQSLTGYQRIISVY
jgi:hypothetical protein